MRELALFAGAGGGILGGHLLGWRTVCAVEIEDYPRRVLLARQRDGMLPRFPIWDDVTTFDGTQWRGRVDVISGGFPCQDISAAGRGAGITGAKSGLWTHMARIIGEVRPRYVFVENSPLLVSRGLDVVLSDLAALGYDAAWGVVGAHHVGAPHKRDRIWIRAELADAVQDRQSWTGILRYQYGAKGTRRNTAIWCDDRETTASGSPCATLSCEWIPSPESIGRIDGLAEQLDRLAAIGNGQVPAVAALAWNLLTNQLEE